MQLKGAGPEGGKFVMLLPEFTDRDGSGDLADELKSLVGALYGRCPWLWMNLPRPGPRRTDIWRTGKIAKRADGRIIAGQAVFQSSRASGL